MLGTTVIIHVIHSKNLKLSKLNSITIFQPGRKNLWNIDHLNLIKHYPTFI